MKIILFGAGNIGRSFIAPLFHDGGYEVVFVDVNTTIVDALNRQGEYPVITVQDGAPPERVTITGVRAIDGRNTDQVAAELATATVAATAVGKAALPTVARAIAAGLRARPERSQPLDVILAENLRDAAQVVREATTDEPAAGAVSLGLVETSIGKMVPIVPAAEAARDPLVVFAEPYNTLIVDRQGFLGPVPSVPGLKAVERIDAYVDRKLFVHNLGHAACAYHSYQRDESVTLIADAVRSREVEAFARAAMNESAAALVRAYPDVFTADALAEHVDELLRRFANRALGDTVHRVGRDLPRKLGRDDRLVGAMRLCAAHGLSFTTIANAYLDALQFRAADEGGHPHAADVECAQAAQQHGLKWTMQELSGLDPQRDRLVMETLRKAHSQRRPV